MLDLGEEFAKICIQWLKKALAWLVYAFWLHSARVFPHLETLKKNIGKLNSLTVRKKKKKKKKKKSRPDRPNFQILVGWGQHKHFFFLALLPTPCWSNVMNVCEIVWPGAVHVFNKQKESRRYEFWGKLFGYDDFFSLSNVCFIFVSSSEVAVQWATEVNWWQGGKQRCAKAQILTHGDKSLKQ